MKNYRIVIDVMLPEDFNESQIDTAIADAIFNVGGEVTDVKEYEEITE